jgi:hypothetical protein
MLQAMGAPQSGLLKPSKNGSIKSHQIFETRQHILSAGRYLSMEMLLFVAIDSMAQAVVLGTHGTRLSG